MAQEVNHLIEVSNDGVTWTELGTAAGLSFKHSGIAIPSTKYYRVIAKGNGVDTLDSPPSAAISISNGYSTEYQNVLNNATTLSISHPSLSQNIANDFICRKLVAAGKWVDIDVFWYWEQELGTPYEFLTLNWIDPTKHRFINQGANPVDFEGGLGFSVVGSNSQRGSTQFTPSTDAVNFLQGEYSVIFKLFKIPPTYTSVLRILGGGNMNVLQSANANILNRIYETGNSGKILPSNSLLNNEITVTETGGIKKMFVNGNSYGDANQGTPATLAAPITVFSTGTTASEGPFGMGYLMFKKGEFDNGTIYDATNNEPNPIAKDGVLKLTAAGTSIASFLFTQVVEASKFPMLTTTKNYIVLLGTDHASPSSAGACIWGEADSPNLTGFIERGTIVSGNQSETPFLQYVPDDPDGEVVHFYYHPDSGHPDSLGPDGNTYQQTRLLTRTAGDLHDPTGWTDRGKVLGMIDPPTTEQHTGYLQTYKQPDGSFVGVHNTKGAFGTTQSTIPRIGISTAPSTGRAWTRVTSYLDNTSFMVAGRQFHMSPQLYFTRNAIQYCVARNVPYDFSNGTADISIVQCDGNYAPTTFISNITSPQGGYANSTASYYIDPLDPDTLHIYYVVATTDMYHTTWNLKNLD